MTDARSTTPPVPASSYQAHWLAVLCLIGLDYFSTLAYQPSIAVNAAGYLAPFATLLVVLVTLFAVVPVFAYVAARSPEGRGSLLLLERVLHGWRGKTIILILLGFAATDFVLTKTLSVADAAEHIVRNPSPVWQESLERVFAYGEQARAETDSPFLQTLLQYWNRQVIITLLLLILGFVFWAVLRKGFTPKVIRIAIVVTAAYLTLNAVLLGSGLWYLHDHPQLLENWWTKVWNGQWSLADSPMAMQSWSTLALACVLLFPKMVLGISGFELSMVVMPLIRGKPGDNPERPRGRIWNARKMLLTAALVMAVYLLASSLVAGILIPPEAMAAGGPANNRALAYLAHGQPMASEAEGGAVSPLCGPLFGLLYDLSTILILCLAGASVILGLKTLVPQYLQRFGMEMHWANAIGLIYLVFNVIMVCVTLLFHADVDDQRGAYATGVWILITSATAGACFHRYAETQGPRWWRIPWYFSIIVVAFSATAVAIIVAKPEGLKIAVWFIVAILLFSIVSRLIRNKELRFQGFRFKDGASKLLWDSLIDLQFPILVPHRPGQLSLTDRETRIRNVHRLGPEIPVVFVVAEIGDASDFYHQPMIAIAQEDGRFVIHVTECSSIAHTLAAVGLELSKVGQPPEIHFGWSNETAFAATVNFVLYGEGNIPWLVRELICKAESKEEQRPRVIIG